MTLSAGVSWTIGITLGTSTKATKEILWLSVLVTRLWRHLGVCVWVHATKCQLCIKTVGILWWILPMQKEITHSQSVGRFMTHSCYLVCEMSIWIEVIRCAWQCSCFLLLLDMVKVGELCMWLVWDNLRRSTESSILITLSIKQRRQLGDSGRTQRCRSTLVYFLLYSALFVYFPPPPSSPSRPPSPPSPSLSAMTTQKAREMGRGGRSGGESKREKREST